MVICLERGADLHMAQLMPLPLTVSCFSKIQIGFAFLVPAHLGSPRKMAVKWVCVCVCLASVKSRLVLPFWYRPTRVVLDKGPLNRCVCVCVCACVRACFDTVGHQEEYLCSINLCQLYVKNRFSFGTSGMRKP